jgi:hypothetical protein
MLPGNGLRRVALDARCLNRPHLRGMGVILAEMLAADKREMGS